MSETIGDPVDDFLKLLMPGYSNEALEIDSNLPPQQPYEAEIDQLWSQPLECSDDTSTPNSGSSPLHSHDLSFSPDQEQQQAPTMILPQFDSTPEVAGSNSSMNIPFQQQGGHQQIFSFHLDTLSNSQKQPSSGSDTKKKKRPRAAEEETPTDAKRAHMLRDKARRHDLNDGIERLRKCITFDLGTRPTKAEIVHSAAETITNLQNQVEQLKFYIQQLESGASAARATQILPPQTVASIPYAPMSSTSTSGLFFAFIMVFIIGSISPIAHLTLPITRSLLGTDSLESSVSPATWMIRGLIIGLVLYFYTILSTSYIKSKSVKYERAAQAMKIWSHSLSDRAAARVQADLVRQLLGRKTPTGLSWLLALVTELIRFILLRLRIGFFFERAALWMKRVEPEVLYMELSASLNWLETKVTWESGELVVEGLRMMNLMDAIKHKPDDANLIFLKISLSYLIGNLLGYREWFLKPIGYWCLRFSTSLAESVPEDLPVAQQDAVEDNLTPTSRTSALLASLGIRAFKEFVRLGQGATASILEGRISSARDSFAATLAATQQLLDNEASPILLRASSLRTAVLLAYLNYIVRNEDASPTPLIQAYQAADRFGDTESLVSILVTLVYTKIWKKSDYALEQARGILSFCRSRFHAALAVEVMLSQSLFLADIILAVHDGNIMQGLALLETGADFLEKHVMDPRLMIAPSDFARLSLRLCKIVALSRDESVQRTLSRVVDVTHRSFALLELQMRSVKFAELFLHYYKGRFEAFQSQTLYLDPAALSSSAKKRFERCVALCRETGLVDWKWLLLKCEKRIARLDMHSEKAAETIVTHRKPQTSVSIA